MTQRHGVLYPGLTPEVLRRARQEARRCLSEHPDGLLVAVSVVTEHGVRQLWFRKRIWAEVGMSLRLIQVN